MKSYYITFRSVTWAQRGEKLLEEKGIRCALQRTPRWMEEQGCGYCLRIWTQDVRRPVKLLEEARISMRRVYLQREDGLLEEVVM